MIFDTHAHIVSDDTLRYPQTSGGRRSTTTAEDLLAAMDGSGVARACVVQRFYVYGYDNSYVLDAAQRYPDRLTAVISIDAEQPAAAERLRTLCASRRIGGIRLAATSLDRRDTGWLDSPAALRTWRAATELRVPICVHILRNNRRAALSALRRALAHFPEAFVIVDHVGAAHAAPVEVVKARAMGLSEAELELFQGQGAPGYGVDGDLLALGDYPRVLLKISSINLDRLAGRGESGAPFVARLLEVFGEQRVVWGSDFGQSEGHYSHMVRSAHEATSQLSATSRQSILRGNAEAVYAAGRQPAQTAQRPS